jgi:uncharacterized protein YfaS (alpha-2-macroglobulin family)
MVASWSGSAAVALRLSLALGLLGAAAGAQSASIRQLSPQGEVAQVRQVSVQFDAPVVAFGEPRLPAPLSLACEGAAVTGSGRWADDRTWLYDFSADLPPGVRCTLTQSPGWQPATGALTGRTSFSFQTGGPAVSRVEPWPGSEIEEDQHFLLLLTGPALEASLAGRTWCEVEGIGERLPARVVTGAAREAVLRDRGLEKRSAQALLLSCQRPLPQGAKVRLMWGAGIAAAANPKVATRSPQRFDFQVRAAFTAEFSCERERADAPCLPIRPMRLGFSSPVPRALAQQVRLQAEGGPALAPVFDKDDAEPRVSGVVFPSPLAENARFRLVLPPGLRDGDGRPLANAASYPLAVATGDAPPIAKFAAAPFGILEHGPEAVLPVTLRQVQGDLRPAAPGGSVRIRRLESAADVLAWHGRVRRFHESRIAAREAGLPRAEWTEVLTETDGNGRAAQRVVDRQVGTREVSLLKDDAAARRLDLPRLQGGDPRPFEVLGIPITEPGYHVVEIESRRLGTALLAKPAPMYVRTGVLVTNLGLHFKHGRENSLAWVTSLDRGRPVAGAEVTVHDCHGQTLWNGRTDARGLARIAQPLSVPDTQSRAAGRRACPSDEGLFVTARHAGPSGSAADMAFVFSSWQQGIEPWRFNVRTSDAGSDAEVRAHTVFDRTLLRAGETLSMKHFVRLETGTGLAALKPDALPTRLRIQHLGSGQEYTLPLQWLGTRSALSSWAVPQAARLGLYATRLETEPGEGRPLRQWASGEFRVEEFRLPLVDARLLPPRDAAIAPRELTLGVQMNHFSGGPMAQAPLRATALLRPRALRFTGYEDFSFEPPRDPVAEAAREAEREAAREESEGAAASSDGRLIADRQPLATAADGSARWVLKDLPPITRPAEVLAEVSFNDPNGEQQTVATTVPVWPSGVVLGVRTGSWASRRGDVGFSVLALDTAGRPIKGQAVEVRGRLAQTISTRKRLVGGFYAYDNRTEMRELGPLCSGRSDAQGLLQCTARLDTAGQVELVARAADGAGHAAQAATSVWVTQQGEVWFGQDNDDRIDVLPEKKRYAPGETARLQVRMPFREATALVAVEREGIIDTRLVTLRGSDPTVDLKIDPAWGPNVYVSVLAVRGRIRDVRWYSFFDWGWKSPVDWARSFWVEGREYQAPTAMVDLSKPAFKLGVAALQVGLAAHELQVSVTADKPQYGVRQKAMARIRVTQGGQPVAGVEVAFAAVDEGLLALSGNPSWDLLPAMFRERAWGVSTSTAQGEIIGRRHYGRKAVAAGGGGGMGGTRELFDTLLLWRGRVALDARGEAVVEVPLNDSLTAFRLVAVADDGGMRFGSGSTSVRVTQDLQMLSGLPPLVREGDRFQALMTLRNTTAREMTLRAALVGRVEGGTAGGPQGGAALALAPQELRLPPGGAREIGWAVEVPVGAERITWEGAVQETGTGKLATDRIRVTQAVRPAVPLRVLQATLQPLDGAFSMAVAPPAGAWPAQGGTRDGPRGGLVVAVQPTLTGALPGIRRFFENYPFSCLEQQASRAVGLRDAAGWAALVGTLPTYLDRDGLAAYFPPRAEDAARGSDRLTAYLLAASHEAGLNLPPATRDAMLDGLTAFVQGRIERRFWSPRPDLDVRKLAAIEALARHGRAAPRMLGSIALTPNAWPTSALIDWLSILKRMDAVPDRTRRLAEANQLLRARLAWSGTTLKFSNEADDAWWWLMESADANAARLILAVLDDPAWRAELPRMVVGSLGRQQGGAWLTTTANLWGSLALDKFSAAFESVPVRGRTLAGIGSGIGISFGSSSGATPTASPASPASTPQTIQATQAARAIQAIDWAASPVGGRMLLPWPAAPGRLEVTQQGSGKPWLTVQSLAAIPLAAPMNAGYGVTRSITAVQQKNAPAWSRGDVLRVRVQIDALADMSWVVLSDPVPGGATVLGSGLGRDSALAARGEQRAGLRGDAPEARAGAPAVPAFDERGFEAFRRYFEFLPRGRHVVEYTVRLNNPGRFALPPTRVEAMYAPESFGETPNATLEVTP